MATAVCTAMLVISTFSLLDARRSPAGAATVVGAATITTTGGQSTGGSSSTFSLVLPEGAACSGDSASAGYKVQSYMVPDGVDPGTLVYGNTGPTPSAFGTSFRKPLYSSAGQAFVNKLTDVQTGVVTGLPSFNFALFKPNGIELVPPGTYNIGISCTLGTGAEQVLDRYWNARIAIVADEADPNGIGWSIPEDTGTTTTTVDGTTTTTVPDGGTTTTTEDTSTTSTTAVGTVIVGPPLVLSEYTLVPGGSVVVQGKGWAPGSEVEIFMKSDPVYLATLTADDNGAIDGPVSIPTDVQPGSHTITALGVDSTGTIMGSSADVTVRSPEQQATGGAPTAASAVSVAGQLPYTGSSPLPLLFWAVCLLGFGRIAMLLGKRPKVIGDEPTG